MLKYKKKQTNEQANNYAQRISKMDAKFKCVNKPKKCRTNLAITSPKKQITTQRKSATLNFKFNTKFSANRNDHNSILQVY